MLKRTYFPSDDRPIAVVIGSGFGGLAAAKDKAGEDQGQNINTGLLPAWLGFTGTTRQNDVDVSFTISMQPNVSDNSLAGDNKTPLFRQTFLTFGDKSWGSIKLGKDLGIYAADAILNDMTLLGVGGVANTNGAAWMGSGSLTTIGGIGTGYIYAAWKGQIAYTTPNFNGFQATVGITNPNQGLASSGATSATAALYQDRFGLEGQASYSFAANDVTGKVWVSGFSQKVNGMVSGETAYSADIGANLKAGAFDLTGYYYTGEGTGTTIMLRDGYSLDRRARESDGGYVQAKVTLPTKTVAGISWGRSNLDRAGTDADGSNLVKENEMTTAGLYHPLTKSINLVAEYSHVKSQNHANQENKNNVGSLGAILFF